jgi:hypothetical protein
MYFYRLLLRNLFLEIDFQTYLVKNTSKIGFKIECFHKLLTMLFPTVFETFVSPLYIYIYIYIYFVCHIYLHNGNPIYIADLPVYIL